MEKHGRDPDGARAHDPWATGGSGDDSLPSVSGCATLTSPEHCSLTASFLGKLSNSLSVLDVITFAKDRGLLVFMLRQWYSVNDRIKNFIINHIESDLRGPGIEPGSLDSQSIALPI